MAYQAGIKRLAFWHNPKTTLSKEKKPSNNDANAIRTADKGRTQKTELRVKTAIEDVMANVKEQRKFISCLGIKISNSEIKWNVSYDNAEKNRQEINEDRRSDFRRKRNDLMMWMRRKHLQKGHWTIKKLKTSKDVWNSGEKTLEEYILTNEEYFWSEKFICQQKRWFFFGQILDLLS